MQSCVLCCVCKFYDTSHRPYKIQTIRHCAVLCLSQFLCIRQAKLGGQVVVGKLEEVLHLLQMAAL